MDVVRITSQEGYRYEDLTEENKVIVDWLNYLVDDIEGFESDYQMDLEVKESTLDKIRSEEAISVIEELKEYLRMTILEYQISLIENQPDEEEEANV